MEDFDIIETLESSVFMVAPLAKQRGIQIIKLNFSQEQLIVHGDRLRLKQVFINILSNAVKYDRDNGTVTIETLNSSDKNIRVFITDTGPGIPSENQKTIFEPFTRLSRHEHQVSGTGIGLFISRQLMELMKGSVSLEETSEKGSCFAIELPLGQPSKPGTSHNTGSSATLTDKLQAFPPSTLLYIEDNVANLHVVQGLLSLMPNLTMLEAMDASEGIRLAHTEQPNLILMDINLPEMSGIEAFKILKTHDDTKNIPVIAVSANAMKKDIEKTISAGFLAYVTKPFNFETLLEAIYQGLTKAKGH
jgi:CheY-like chemotaxis protein/anti-sigma regulatory factor (Ser/Thr protein kinase)